MRSRASYENNLRLSREAKRRRTGTCENCGAVTRYNGKTINGPSRLCLSCAAVVGSKARIGTGPMQLRLYALLDRRGEAGYTEIRAALGISRGYAGALLTHELKGQRVKRVRRGVYQRG